MGTSHRGLQEAYTPTNPLVAGRSTQRELDRNFYRKWATNQAKAWEKMLKVSKTQLAIILIYLALLCFPRSIKLE